MRYEPITVYSGVASGTASYVVDLRNAWGMSIQATAATGATVGTLSLTFSNDGVNYGADSDYAAPTLTAGSTKCANYANVPYLYATVAMSAGTGSDVVTIMAATKGQ